ncbi:putative prolyl 4-hydroxylase 7 [Cucumis melo var. makuwa]|uniref:procollagen-proline 4-dioxygenase n=1 Tax=Cucumis melo var. makuwa TaxID=1194695 RepID=A0A5D3CTS4_CUCMM|nr:putative prolyl 4-hydroxylase 7 [Cucumis melo var. makuwa]
MDSRPFLAFSLCFLSVFTAFARLPETRMLKHSYKQSTGSVLRLKTDSSPLIFDPTRVTQLSWQPRAFLYKGFLSDEECDHLIDLAKDKLEKSMVADNESGKSVSSEVRTSSGMFLRKAQDKIVAGVEARIAAWTLLPAENGESIQILHYENGQKYEPHFDFFHDKVNQELGGHRIATVLMYLSNVEKGGETIFPNSEFKESQEKDDSWSDCSRKGYAGSTHRLANILYGEPTWFEPLLSDFPRVARLYYRFAIMLLGFGIVPSYTPYGSTTWLFIAVKAQKGDALLFFSLHLDATTDERSLHGSCPVIEGEKWSATKWIHVRSFEKLPRVSRQDCVDENENCPAWAKRGECKKNPTYMVGSEGALGYCRKSCKAC